MEISDCIETKFNCHHIYFVQERLDLTICLDDRLLFNDKYADEKSIQYQLDFLNELSNLIDLARSAADDHIEPKPTLPDRFKPFRTLDPDLQIRRTDGALPDIVTSAVTPLPGNNWDNRGFVMHYHGGKIPVDAYWFRKSFSGFVLISGSALVFPIKRTSGRGWVFSDFIILDACAEFDTYNLGSHENNRVNKYRDEYARKVKAWYSSSFIDLSDSSHSYRFYSSFKCGVEMHQYLERLMKASDKMRSVFSCGNIHFSHYYGELTIILEDAGVFNPESSPESLQAQFNLLNELCDIVEFHK